MWFALNVLFGLSGLGSVNASPVDTARARRQVIQPVPSSTSSNAAEGGGGQPVPMAAVIAISVVLGTGVLVLVLIQIRQWRRRRQGRDNRPTEDNAMQSLTAEDLAGTPRPNRSTGTSGNGTTTGGAQANQRGRRSRRRGVRRTESGRSVKTLPEYSKEAGDEELVLVRRRSGSMSDEDYEANDAGDDLEMTATSSVPITIRSASHSRSRSPPSINVRNDDEDGNITRTPSPIPAAHVSTMETLHDRGWGEAPTYLEAMSAIDPDAPRPIQVPAPRPGTLQRTASGFKELLTRPFAPGAFRSPSHAAQSGNSTPASGSRSRAGSTSALLHPTISRFSTATSATGGNAEYPSPWTSSQSLLISPPVPNSALRASFDGSSIPKGGLTKEQMRFLSSSEAVNLVGIRLEDTPQQKRRRRSDMSGQGTPGSPRRESEEMDELPPPSWEQLDGERRRSEAHDRRNLALPVRTSGEVDDGQGEVFEEEVLGQKAEPEEVGEESVQGGAAEKGTGTVPPAPAGPSSSTTTA